MIPCWTAPMVVPKEDDVSSPASSVEIAGILCDIAALKVAMEGIDRRIETILQAVSEEFTKVRRRVDKLEKRHTAHLHWTNMGR